MLIAGELQEKRGMGKGKVEGPLKGEGGSKEEEKEVGEEGQYLSFSEVEKREGE